MNMIDALVKVPQFITRSRIAVRGDGQAGVENPLGRLDTGFRRNDAQWNF
ncbi:MAG: hypothetical protein K8R45_10570 [Desulfobacterales bacterium]|nr:hypothetical protein [Desulfobacterales bacterium]